VEGKAAFTNNVYTGAFRSFGGYQIAFGIESLMDELSVELGIDPLDLRMRNVLKKGSRTITGQVLEHDPCYIEILTLLRERSGWDTKRKTPRGDGSRRGMGLALCFYGLSLGYLARADISEAKISVNEDGSIMIASVYTDCGSGGKTALCQIAAEALGVSYEAVQYLEPDTSRVVDCGPLVGSRTVLCGGNAVMEAARKLKEKILAVASDMMEADPENLTVKENRIFVSGSPAKFIEVKDVAAECFKKGVVLSDQGIFKAPSLKCDPATGQGSPYFVYASGGHVAEVETDPLTGKVRLSRYVAVHNAGKVVNPDGFTGQIEGAVAMGMGCAVLEQLYPKNGKRICRNFGE
jgi:CO/xanthine dehydrogenase Mo-binding subunit